MANVRKGSLSGTMSGTIKDPGPEDYKFLIGEYLAKAGQITRRQLDEAVEHVKKNGGFVGSYLLQNGDIDENTIPSLLTRNYSYTVMSPMEAEIDPKLLHLMPYETASRFLAFPIRLRNGIMEVAMTEPTNDHFIDELQLMMKVRVKAGVATRRSIIEAYRKHYRISDEEYRALSGLQPGHAAETEEAPALVDNLGELISDAAEEFTVEDYGDEDLEIGQVTKDAPIVKLVNQILVKAVVENVTEIHVEPFERQFYVRYRIDGALFKAMKLPLELKGALLSRLRVMANLNMTDRRTPQRGRFRFKIGRKKAVDFIMSTIPTLYGESVVLHVRDLGRIIIPLSEIGLSDVKLKDFMQVIGQRQGLFIMAGPSGSGKTSTLYSTLALLNNDDVKIMTAEDPLDFSLAGINQVNVTKEQGLSPMTALEAFLHQSADVVMLSRIAGPEAAGAVLELAMTGKLVLSTMAANDSVNCVYRLLSLGIPPHDLAGYTSGILSQRLLRRVCPDCKKPVSVLSRNALLDAGFEPHELDRLKLVEGKGCSKCAGTGYRGRIGCFELFRFTPKLRDALNAGATETEFRRRALKEGHKTLRRDALFKASVGLTTVEEAVRNTPVYDSDLPDFLAEPHELTLENGDILIYEGNEDKDLYKLVRGRLIVYKGKDKVAEITEPGSYFGETSTLFGASRTATIRAAGRTVVQKVPGDKIVDILANHPEVARELLLSMARQLQSTRKRLVEVLDKSRE